MRLYILYPCVDTCMYQYVFLYQCCRPCTGICMWPSA